jgi:hypothetical protein
MSHLPPRSFSRDANCRKLRYSASGFLYIPLPASLAGNITHELNRAGASRLLPSSSLPRTKEEVEKNVDAVYGAWLEEQYEAYLSSSVGQGSGQVVFSDKYHGDGGKDLPTMGYVTRDLCPGRGDDIDHVPGMSLVFVRLR